RRSKARLRKSQRLGKVIVGFMVLLLFLLCCFVFDALLISRPEIWSAAITAAGALAGLVFYPFPFEAREDNRHSLVTILNSEMLAKLDQCGNNANVRQSEQRAMAWYREQLGTILDK